ncbi:MAG: Flp pilus assembly protein CpaB [Parvularculaceae bacterium]
MNVRQIAVLGIAAIAGLGAFLLMMSGGQQAVPVVVQEAEKPGVRILVADADLSRGDRLTAEALKWVEWPEDVASLSPQLIREGTVELADLERAVVRSSFVVGEPVIEAKILRAGDRSVMAAVLEAGKRAVTVRVTAESASGGFVLPGDRVDVYYTEPDSLTGEITFQKLFESVKVLAIDNFFDNQSDTPHIAGQAATLELGPGDAEFFTTARASRGELTLALRSAFDGEKEAESVQQRRAVQVVRYGRS